MARELSNKDAPIAKRISPLLKYLEGAVTGKYDLYDGVKGVHI